MFVGYSGCLLGLESGLSRMAEAAITNSSDPAELEAYLKAALDIMAILKAGFGTQLLPGRVLFVEQVGNVPGSTLMQRRLSSWSNQ